MKQVTISAGYTKALLEYATQRGADRNLLVQRTGLLIEDLSDQDYRVPLATHITLLRASIELCGDPALALHFGATVRMPDVTIVGLIGANCDTVEEARRQLNRYSRLAIDSDDIVAAPPLDIVRERGAVWLEFSGSVYRKHPHVIEFIVAQSVFGARELFADTQYMQRRGFPQAIHFAHAAPPYHSEYERLFNVPIVFNAQRNALLIDDEFLAIKLPGAHRYVFGLLSRKADSLMQSLLDSRALRDQVQKHVLPILHKGAVQIKDVAAQLGMSRQTLFRKLKAEGVTFTQLVDELRRQMALHYLDCKRVSVNEVAYLVGFSDPAAFSRAFKRWTGSSPRQSKKQ